MYARPPYDHGYIWCPVCRMVCKRMTANAAEAERRPYVMGFSCSTEGCPIGVFYVSPKFSANSEDPYGDHAKGLRQLQARVGDDAALLEDLSGAGQRPPRRSTSDAPDLSKLFQPPFPQPRPPISRPPMPPRPPAGSPPPPLWVQEFMRNLEQMFRPPDDQEGNH